MLAFAFGISIFSSSLWLFYTISYIFAKLGGANLSSLGLTEFSIYISLIVFPIFLIWTIFGFINQFLANRVFNKNLYTIFGQMKKSQDYVDLMARVMIESEQQIKDGFILGNMEIFITDLNEILSEIIYRCKIASKEQIDDLWKKTQNGGKWSFGKVLIEVSQSQAGFATRVLDKANYDAVLAGSVLEFCARYLSIVNLLEKHDRDKIFITIIETGVMGKVFSVLAPISDEIQRHREIRPVIKQQYHEPEVEKVVEHKAPIINKINIFKKKEEPLLEKNEPLVVEQDSFSAALERSFSDEPKFEIDEPVFEISSTQKALDDMKKDWNEMSAKVEPMEEKEEPSLAYPFGGWTNEDNYK